MIHLSNPCCKENHILPVINLINVNELDASEIKEEAVI